MEQSENNKVRESSKVEKKKPENREQGQRKHGLWMLAFGLLLCVQVLVLLYFGSMKAGFHEDEYYSYYSTNRTAGLYQPDREWVERDTFRNEFVVLEGERFRYGLVSLVQSWDVHPPFYYFILHTACSFFPGVFSKWLGIGINILAFCINFLLLSWLAYRVSGRNRKLAFAVAAVHGWNAVIISGVMFIRMYEWLTVFVLLCACLHVKAVTSKQMRIRSFLLPLMVVNYLGFLTQYYYIIFLFFIAAGFCLWRLVQDRHIWNCMKYGLACGLSLVAAVVSYPACVSHIFRGYRGTGAVSEFVNVQNTGERIRFFGGLMNEYLFDGMMWLWLILLAVLLGVFIIAGKKGKGLSEEGIACLLLACAVTGYFFTVSKTALLLYETSNRYQLPIYGLVLMLLIVGVYSLWKNAVHIFCCGNEVRANKLINIGMAAVLMVLLAGDIHGICAGKVIFLYQEDAALMDYAKTHANTPVIILYNDATPYHVWWCSQELMQYEKVYFASQANKEPLTDEILCNSENVIVYAADYETQEESLQMILDSNEKLSGYKQVGSKSLWSVYEFGGDGNE